MPNTHFTLITSQRSGCHAVSNWILHQNKNVVSEMQLDHMHPSIDGWKIENDKYIGVLFNNVGCNDKEIASYPTQKESSVISLYESGKSLDIRKITPTLRLKSYYNIEKEYYILALRDFRNFAASSYFKHGLLHDHLARSWEDRARIIINLENQPTNFHFINYNMWFTSKTYRQSLVDKFELYFNDYGFATVPHFGGGSSFHGKEFDGKNTEMEVLTRYKYYDSNQHFQSILNKNYKLVEMSDYIFGKPGSWSN